MDITTIFGLLIIGLCIIAAYLVSKIQKILPELESAINTSEQIREKSGTVLGLFENVELLLKSLVESTKDGEITNDEAQKLLAEVVEISKNPAFSELKKLIEEKE